MSQARSIRTFSARAVGGIAVFVCTLAASVPAKAWHGGGFGCGSGSYLSTWGSYGMGGGFRTPAPSLSFSTSGWCGVTPAWSSCGNGWGTGIYPRAIIYSRYASPICYRPISYRACFPATWSYTSCYGPWYGCSSWYTYDAYCLPTYYRVNYGWQPWLYPNLGPFVSSRSTSSPRQVAKIAPSFVPPSSLRLVNLKEAAEPADKPPIQPITDQTKRGVAKSVDRQIEESWVVLAIELIDNMVYEGGGSQGLQACEQLIKVRPELPSEVFWRAAILAAVEGRSARQVVAFIDQAEARGDGFNLKQLPGGSLRGYLRRAGGGSIDEAMNRLASSALRSDNPRDEYRALATFLKWDGQVERSQRFVEAWVALGDGGKDTPQSESSEPLENEDTVVAVR